MRHAFLGVVVLALAPGIAAAQWSDNFDSYAAGSLLAGQGGWQIWYIGGFDGTVWGGPPPAASAPNSLKLVAGSDLVQLFTIVGGKWTMKVKLYIPTGATGNGYVIMLNTYNNPLGPDNWSLQVRFGGNDNLVAAESNPTVSVPLIRDQWVELRAEIDLVGDVLDLYYGGNPLSLGRVWTNNVSWGGRLAIDCIDLFSGDMNDYFYDDVSLMPAQQGAGDGDLNCDGVINAFDIDAFVKCLTTGTPTPPCPDCQNADINDDGVINAFDIDPFVVCLTTGNC